MDKISGITASAIIISMLSAAAFADPACNEITKDYFDYDKGLPASASSQIFPYPWQDMPWLSAKLGTSSPVNIKQKIATWKRYHYTIVEENGVVVSNIGQVATVTPGTLVDQATMILGAPDVLQANVLSQYTWNCDNNSSLTVTSNDTLNGAIVEYKGNYCATVTAQQVCQKFSNYQVSFPSYLKIGAGIQTASLYVQHPPTQPQYTDQQAAAIAESATIQTLKVLDKDLSSLAQIPPLAAQELTNFYANLQQCKVGTYQYAYPFILGGRLISTTDVAPYYFVATSKVQGMFDGKCTVVTSAQIGKNNASMNCQYTPQDLQMFTAQKAVMDASNESNFDPTQQAQARALLRDCQPFFNGSLVTTGAPI
jgi:hypothetical protein